MDILLNDSQTLAEIQTSFASHFPFLKLEFFTFKNSDKKVFSKANLVKDTSITLGMIRSKHYDGKILFDGKMTADSLEKHFDKYFGMDVQVFRKAGSVWLRTIDTDNRTLNELNLSGKTNELPLPTEVASDFDAYHEQE
jgi:hypothetical protein